MNNVKLLDCTLRDGGFVSNWVFGHDTIINIFELLYNSNLDIIEVGYLYDKCEKDYNKARFPNTKALNETFEKVTVDNGKSMVVAMIDFGDCAINNICDCKDSFIDGIRVTFKKKNIDEAIEFCKLIKGKGYDVFAQPVSITTYSDREMIDLIEKINLLNPYAMSIVDTYGLMHKNDLIRYFYLMDNNLNKDVSVGYHSHNNFQLGYANAIELLEVQTYRNIILDTSCYGIGKSAGNTCTELMAMYLNENYEKKYDIGQILEIIDIDIMKIYNRNSWGYKIDYFISASNKCHPKYVEFLKNKNMLSIKSINEILCMIDDDKRLFFSPEHIEELYLKYQNNIIDDSKSYEYLKKKLINKNILILGPGKTLLSQKDKIQEYIERSNPLVISVNCIPNIYKLDYVFVSNSKRYYQLSNKISNNNEFEVITTSNISDSNNNIKLNYYSLIPGDKIHDNSMCMLINIMINIGIKEINLAGFDGFTLSSTKNYYDNFLEFDGHDLNDKVDKNKYIKDKISEFRKKININFITNSIYDKEEELVCLNIN